MKKFLATLLSLALCLGVATGCAGKETPAANSGKDVAETGVKEIPSLKIAFSPYADADQITTATEPLEQLLQAKLLEKGYDVKEIDMTVGTSYTAVGEALSAGSADIGFISGGNYVLFSDDCDVLLTSSSGRRLLMNTALIAPKTTKSTQGVAVMSLKAKRVLERALPLKDSDIQNTARYRVRSIPAAGALIKGEDRAEKQLSLMDE